MRGQLLLALIVGVLAGVGCAVLGLAYAVVIGVLAGLFGLVPMFGPILSVIPAVIVAVFVPFPTVIWVLIQSCIQLCTSYAAPFENSSGPTTESEATRQVASPLTPSSSRLVARTCSFGHVCSSVSTTRAAASMTCSQLSRTTSTLRPRRCSVSSSSGSRPGVSGRPPARRDRLSDQRRIRQWRQVDEPDTVHKSRTSWRATSSARRVLPQPPEPVIVSSRASRNRCATRSISPGRATYVVL